MRTVNVHLETNNNYSTFLVFTGVSATGPWVPVVAPNNIVQRAQLANVGGHAITGVPVDATHIMLRANTGYCGGHEVVIAITQQVI